MKRRAAPDLRRYVQGDCRARRRGQALVEFALILPVFLLLFLIAADVGRLFFSYIAINNAAREGAAYAATNPAYTAQIQAHILQEANVQSQSGAGSISAPTVTCQDATGITIACSAAAGGLGPGNTVTVGISQPFTFYTPLVNGFFNNNLNLGAKATAAVLFYTASTGGTPPSGCIPPTASFTVVVNGTTITTNPSASTPSSGTWNISGYNWAWGDGTKDVGTATSTTHTYAVSGPYQIALNVTNQCGQNTLYKTVTIGTYAGTCTVPTASFTYVQGAGSDSKTFAFTDTSSVTNPADCPITTWVWNFGDGTMGNAQNPTHTYHDGSAHTVTLIVTNAAGNSPPHPSTQ